MKILEKIVKEISSEQEKIIEYAHSHNRGVTTGIYNNIAKPLIHELTIGERIIPIISILKRNVYEEEGHDPDANPLIYAMKNVKDWRFKDPKRDIFRFFRRAIQIAKRTDLLKKSYDTLIKIPSKSELNNILSDVLERLILFKNPSISEYFVKIDINEMWEYINYNQIAKDCGGKNKKYEEKVEELKSCLDRQQTDLGATFSFKKLPNEYRKYIGKCFKQEDAQLDLSEFINDCNILICDDTITTETSISRMCQCVCEFYIPKSITVVTLLS
ncbi:MAG: hypothetical protein FWH18_10685 [Marinilabiliaceae bacterium]|nr:hypothetical protein [Marinilabiliaceae bacterium]